MRVLVVEDHPKLALTVATGLRHAGMAVDVAFDGRDALDQVAEADYDVVVLDRDLPGVSGDEVCRRLVRHGSTIRVLMLTAAGDLDDKVTGFELGADDYLTKPFELRELVVRLRALVRRPAAATPTVIEYAGVRLDPQRRAPTTPCGGARNLLWRRLRPNRRRRKQDGCEPWDRVEEALGRRRFLRRR